MGRAGRSSSDLTPRPRVGGATAGTSHQLRWTWRRAPTLPSQRPRTRASNSSRLPLRLHAVLMRSSCGGCSPGLTRSSLLMHGFEMRGWCARCREACMRTNGSSRSGRRGSWYCAPTPRRLRSGATRSSVSSRRATTTPSRSRCGVAMPTPRRTGGCCRGMWKRRCSLRAHRRGWCTSLTPRHAPCTRCLRHVGWRRSKTRPAPCLRTPMSCWTSLRPLCRCSWDSPGARPPKGVGSPRSCCSWGRTPRSVASPCRRPPRPPPAVPRPHQWRHLCACAPSMR